MGYKRVIRKIAKFILASQPESFVQVNIGQIQSGIILFGKKIVITGGGSGLGFAMAKKFVSEGAEVLISGRNEEKLKTATRQLGDHAKYITADVCDVEHSMAFLEKAKEQLGGRIDCLVSNAGVSLHENTYLNVTVEGFDKQFNTKFRAGYFLGKAFLAMKTKEKSEGDLNAQLLYITSETGDQVYDIPYRCLIPTKVENILVAGRCISSDSRAHGSTRSMPCCMATGEAAGVAASLAIKSNVVPRNVNVENLRALLQAQGVLLR